MNGARVPRVMVAFVACAVLGAASSPSSRATGLAPMPEVVTRGTPVLPESLVALGLSGWALAQVAFDSAGAVTMARALDPEASRFFFGPHAAAFESSAVAAARQYRVAPGQGQSSAAGVYVLEIRFALEDSSSAPTGTLVGLVRDRDHGWVLSNAAICLADARLATLSRGGTYRLERVPAGRHQVEVSARGYCPVRRTVTMRAEATEALDVELQPCPGTVLERCFSIWSPR